MNRRTAALAAWALAVPHTLFLVGYLVKALTTGPDLRDWYVFKLAAERFVAGRFDLVYPADFHAEGWRFLYPPYALWAYVPLAFLTDTAAFWAFTAVQVGAIAAAVALVARRLPADRAALVVVAAAVVSSAPLAYQVLLGQNSGVFLLALTASAALLPRRPVAAGVALGVLALKPHWVLAPLGLLLLFERRAFVGLASTIAALLASSFVGGTTLWRRFFAMATAQVELTGDQLEGRHNIAVRGVLVGLLGPGHQGLVDAIWAVAVLVVTPLVVWAWTKPVSSWRKLSMVALYLVAMNLYVNSYDGLALILPLLDLLFGPDRLPDRSRTGLLGLAALWWLADQACYVYPVLTGLPYPPFATGGLVALVWLLVLVRDAGSRA